MKCLSQFLMQHLDVKMRSIMTTVHRRASLGEGPQTRSYQGVAGSQLRTQKEKVRKTIYLTILF